jgi:hypothetical protein
MYFLVVAGAKSYSGEPQTPHPPVASGSPSALWIHHLYQMPGDIKQILLPTQIPQTSRKYLVSA